MGGKKKAPKKGGGGAEAGGKELPPVPAVALQPAAEEDKAKEPEQPPTSWTWSAGTAIAAALAGAALTQVQRHLDLGALLDDPQRWAQGVRERVELQQLYDIGVTLALLFAAANAARFYARKAQRWWSGAAAKEKPAGKK